MSFTPEANLAEVRLAAMDLREDLAKRWETAAPGMLRETFADAYRSAVGIHPSKRTAFRTALEAVRDGSTNGDVTVDSIVQRLEA